MSGTYKESINLNRFLEAQEGVYERALGELMRGRKRTHWMWYIFPQILGLGRSQISIHFSIHSTSEAQAYLAHPVLGKRLRECATVVLGLKGFTISKIFGYPDDLKFRSCMTLFGSISGQDSVFNQVLETYFDGQGDPKTIQLLSNDRSSPIP